MTQRLFPVMKKRDNFPKSCCTLLNRMLDEEMRRLRPRKPVEKKRLPKRKRDEKKIVNVKNGCRHCSCRSLPSKLKEKISELKLRRRGDSLRKQSWSERGIDSNRRENKKGNERKPGVVRSSHGRENMRNGDAKKR